MTKEKFQEKNIRSLVKIAWITFITITALGVWVIIFLGVSVLNDYAEYDESWDDWDDGYGYSESADFSGSCNVAGIALQGELYTYAYEDAETTTTGSEDIVFLIEEATKTENIKAILFEIDSLGGTPVAAQEIEQALKRVEIPTVALIREYGDSAAYWAATGADTIFASKLSDVGSIGVTASYFDSNEFNNKEGYTFNQLSTGKFKDMMSPEKELTKEERGLIMRDLKIIHNEFVQTVAENRKLSIAKVALIADGSSMLGEAALNAGLIDQLGGEYEVKSFLTEKLGEEVEICW